MKNNIIEIIDLNKNFGETIALQNINLAIKKSSITGFIGKSGAGKTTLLRCINLLETPDTGQIKIHGKNLLKLSEKETKEFRRKIGMIFQSFNLLTNRNVRANIALPLEFMPVDKKEIDNKVNTIGSLVGLEDKLNSYPNELSGGQKQRVAIARSLVSDVDILLCDEFTSALDPETTLEILSLIKDINTKLGVTIILITHDMSVIREICDFVYVMDNGNLVESGEIEKIFYNPQHYVTKSMINTLLSKEMPNALVSKLENNPSTNCDVVVCLIFASDSSRKAIVSKVIKKFDIAVNIISGHLDHIRNTTLGNLLVTFKYDVILYSNIVKFFQENKVHLEFLGYLKEEKWLS
jgi:D-methionine transport system ATP-binding protein